MRIRIDIKGFTSNDLLGATVLSTGHDSKGPYLLLENGKPYPQGPLILQEDGTMKPESTSKKQEVIDKVRSIIAEKLNIWDSKRLQPEARFVEDLNTDSLDGVELIMAIEDEFDLEIEDDDALKLKTLQDAVDYVYGRVITNSN
jgi:acyl carrier protein